MTASRRGGATSSLYSILLRGLAKGSLGEPFSGLCRTPSELRGHFEVGVIDIPSASDQMARHGMLDCS